MKEIATLLLGAFGALLAIFLKEAVQHALQRRVVAVQLMGYLTAWKSNLVRPGPMATLYMKLEAREQELFKAVAEGQAAWEAVNSKQTESRDALRQEIRAAIEQKVVEFESVELDEFFGLVLDQTADSIGERRKMLTDSKTFISDKDAALLGRVPALNVIRFRSSITDMFVAAEGLIRLARFSGKKQASVVGELVDQAVIHGETALISFMRLERQAEVVCRQHVARSVWDLLRGR